MALWILLTAVFSEAAGMLVGGLSGLCTLTPQGRTRWPWWGPRVKRWGMGIALECVVRAWDSWEQTREAVLSLKTESGALILSQLCCALTG